MLRITIPETDLFDEAKQEFLKTEPIVLTFEHSLVSLHRWESKWEKPFLSNEKKTTEETWSYIQFMCQEDVSIDVIMRMDISEVETINKYIEDKMSATWFRELPGSNRPQREVITAEIIYYWMIALNIPLEWETRHLNQLFTLIKVLNQKNQPSKKVPRQEAAAQRRALNQQRKQALGTSG